MTEHTEELPAAEPLHDAQQQESFATQPIETISQNSMQETVKLAMPKESAAPTRILPERSQAEPPQQEADDCTQSAAPSGEPERDLSQGMEFQPQPGPAPEPKSQPAVTPEPSSEPEWKRGPSSPTIVFGVLGLLIGIVGLAFGISFPNPLFPAMHVDPQIVVAIICAAFGIVLVIIAIVWAVMGAIRKQSTSQPEKR